jgi:hypothetical protein
VDEPSDPRSARRSSRSLAPAAAATILHGWNIAVLLTTATSIAGALVVCPPADEPPPEPAAVTV